MDVATVLADSRAKAHIDKLKTATGEELSQLNGQNDEAVDMVVSLRSQLDSLASALEFKLGMGMKELKAEQDAADHEISVLHRTVGDLKQEVTGLQKKNVQKDEEIDSLHEKLKEREDAYHSLSEENDGNLRKISELTHEKDMALVELEGAKAQIQQELQKIEELESTLEHVKTERDDHLLNVEKLDECLSLKSKELKEMAEFLSTLRGKLQETEDRVSTLELDCKDLQEEVDTKDAQCKTLQHNNSELSRSAMRLENELKDALTRLSNELAEKDDIRSKLITEQVIKESVVDEKNKLMQELGLLRGAQMEQLDEVMALLKAEAITLDRSGCKTIEKILNRAEAKMLSGGDRAAQFKQAQVAIKKEVVLIAGEQIPGEAWSIKPSDIPKIPPHNLKSLRRQLQVLSVMYDCLEDDYKNDNLITTTSEIVNNAPILLSLCRYIKACVPRQTSYTRLIGASPRDSLVALTPSSVASSMAVTPSTSERPPRPRSASPSMRSLSRSPRTTPHQPTGDGRVSPARRSPSPFGTSDASKTHTLRAISPSPGGDSPLLATFKLKGESIRSPSPSYNM